ncbi:MAG: zinc ABC transporter substrate-binding protein [Elusimicrobia bacterium]|nr:zinc ABC transporter substrate-binding protein [Elusimicrobiota bacterium]
MFKKCALAFLFCFLAATAQGAVRVITATEDLAWLAGVVAGELAVVESLSAGDQDLHMVEPRPSMVVKLKKADMIIKVGLDLDMWMDSLIAASRNSKIIYGAPGYVDASVGLELLQVPKGKVDSSMGDLHIYGNPHYWLDPVNARTTTNNIVGGLCRISPGNCAIFKEKREQFLKELDKKLLEWERKLEPFRGSPVVTYHNSWVYFAKRYGLELIGNVEPKPGLPPTPSHIAKLIETMKKNNVKAIMMETYFSRQGPKSIAQKTGARVLVVPSSIGGLPQIKSFFDLFDYIADTLAGALGKKEG